MDPSRSVDFSVIAPETKIWGGKNLRENVEGVQQKLKDYSDELAKIKEVKTGGLYPWKSKEELAKLEWLKQSFEPMEKSYDQFHTQLMSWEMRAFGTVMKILAFLGNRRAKNTLNEADKTEKMFAQLVTEMESKAEQLQKAKESTTTETVLKKGKKLVKRFLPGQKSTTAATVEKIEELSPLDEFLQLSRDLKNKFKEEEKERKWWVK